MIASIDRYLQQVRQLLTTVSHKEIARLIDLLLEANSARRQIFIMGNGGSAATASHFACDLGKGAIVPGFPRFRVTALTDNVPLLTAWGNDTSYDYIFAQQLAGLVFDGDIVIGISGSGNSANVLNGIRLAQRRSAVTVGISGFDGGRLSEMVDLSVHVPSTSMEQVEDVHMILAHLVCTTIREQLRKRIDTCLVPASDNGGHAEGELPRLAEQLIQSLAVPVCSLVLLDPTHHRAVLGAYQMVRPLEDIPRVGRQFRLRQAPTLARLALDGLPVVFKQDDPSSALPPEELHLALHNALHSGAMLPIRVNNEIIAVALLGEMRSWARSPLTEQRVSKGLDLIEAWAQRLTGQSMSFPDVSAPKEEAV